MILIFHQKLNGTLPTDPSVSCDRAVGYSGWGVRSMGPAGNFLDISLRIQIQVCPERLRDDFPEANPMTLQNGIVSNTSSPTGSEMWTWILRVYHGPSKPTFLEVLMANNLVFWWPKLRFLWFWGLMVYYIYTHSGGNCSQLHNSLSQCLQLFGENKLSENLWYETLGIQSPKQRMVMEPKYYAEEVIVHPSHFLTIWLDA